MSVNATNRIHNHRLEVMQAVNIQVREYEIKKRRKSRRSFVNISKSFAICSQCSRGMRKDIADIQKENKRENAPICIACVLGKTRKPLEVIKNRKRAKMSPETTKKYLAFKKSRVEFSKHNKQQ